jgi:hypothetical protein
MPNKQESSTITWTPEETCLKLTHQYGWIKGAACSIRRPDTSKLSVFVGTKRL